jgi:hypothetical protein
MDPIAAKTSRRAHEIARRRLAFWGYALEARPKIMLASAKLQPAQERVHKLALGWLPKFALMDAPKHPKTNYGLESLTFRLLPMKLALEQRA